MGKLNNKGVEKIAYLGFSLFVLSRQYFMNMSVAYNTHEGNEKCVKHFRCKPQWKKLEDPRLK